MLWNAVPRDWVDRSWPTAALASTEARDHTVLVLHDVTNGSLDSLDRFLGTALDRGAELVSICPPRARRSCFEGRVTPDLAPLVRVPTESSS